MAKTGFTKTAFVRERDCKHSIRYKAESADAFAKQIYIQKDALPERTVPERIELALAWTEG